MDDICFSWKYMSFWMGSKKVFGGQKIQLVPIGSFQLLLLLHRLAWIALFLWPAPLVTSQTCGSGASKVAQTLHHLGIDASCFGDSSKKTRCGLRDCSTWPARSLAPRSPP